MAAAMALGAVWASAQGAAPRLALETVPTGPYPVGFQWIDLFDRSRTFRPKYDDQGKLIPGERGRPIQLCIWSPARRNRKNPMRFAEYTHLYPTERIHANRNAEEKAAVEREYADFLARAAKVSPNRILQSEMLATLDAPPADGKFPLIVYSSGNMGEPAENVALFELLASHGFIVAAIPLVGPDERNTTLDRRGVEAATQDLAFAVGYMHDFPGVDFDRVGVMGHSWGGLAALVLKTRNANIDAVLSLDGSVPFLERDVMPELDRASVRGPLMMTAAADTYPLHRAFFDRLKYAEASLLRFDGLKHHEFTSYPWLVRRAEGSGGDATKQRARRSYELLAACALRFFKTHLLGDKDARAWLYGASPPAWADDLAIVETKSPLPAPPSQARFFEMIRNDGFAKAKTVYDQTIARDPGYRLFAEADMNVLGFVFFNDLDRRQEALDIMKLNVAAYPDSRDAVYFLGRIYEKLDDRENALASYATAYGMALAARDADPELEAFKARCRRVIERVKNKQ